MKLNEQIHNDIKVAMKEKDKVTLTTLRALKTAITNFEKAGKGEVDDLVVMDQIKKQVKQRRDSISAYKSAGRQDLADTETAEVEILERYLPEQLDESKVVEEVETVIESLGATSIKDMGRVMATCKKVFDGRADNALVAKIVKQKLT